MHGPAAGSRHRNCTKTGCAHQALYDVCHMYTGAPQHPLPPLVHAGRLHAKGSTTAARLPAQSGHDLQNAPGALMLYN